MCVGYNNGESGLMGDKKYNAYTAYLNMFGDTNPLLTQRNFNDRQLQQLKQAIYNKRYEVNNIPGYYQKVQAYNSRPDITSRDRINLANNAINYGNYDNSSDMGNIVGRFFYNTLPNGDVVVNDRYDFNKLEDANMNDWRYLPIKYGRAKGTPYNININLGNPNTWGNMRYTGNDKLGITGE